MHNSQWYLIFSRDPCARVVLFISMSSWEVLYDSARVSGHLCIVKMCLSHSQSHWTSSADIWQYLTGYIIKRSLISKWMMDDVVLCHFNFNLRVLPICICQYLLSICFPFQIEHSSVAGGTIPSVSQGFQEAGGRQVPEITAGLSPLLDDVPPGETASQPVPLFVGTRPWNMRDFWGFCVRSQYNKALFSTLSQNKSKRFRRCGTIWYCAEWSSKVARG